MLKHNFTLFLRFITRQKVHFALTISGMTLGFTAVLLAFTFIQDEKNYDSFHENADRIFRVNKWVTEPTGDRNKNAETPGLMAPTIAADFPEVEAAARLAPWFDEVLVSYQDQSRFVENWIFADSNFFRLFDFTLLRGGDPMKVLSQPGQILLTNALAKSLFGKQDPIGKTIKGLGDKLYNVAGIIEDAPRNSHIQYDALVSWSSTQGDPDFLNFTFINNWLGQTVYTYIMLRQSEQASFVDEKLADFTAKYMPNRTQVYSFYLQPFKDIYLKSSELMYLRGGKYGSMSFLRTFSIIAILVLLIACFNYINITTARSLERGKEVGVKKVLGAGRRQLLGQFLTETAGLSFMAAIIALALSQLLLPQINLWFKKDIASATLNSLPSIGFLMGVVILTSVIGGLFPALLLTRFRPAQVLRRSFKLSPGGELPRQILTTLQLTISVGLIAATLFLHRQFQFILDRDLGFDKDQVIVMHTPPGIDSSAVAFRQSLESLPGVLSVSMCQAAMRDGTFGTTVFPEGSGGEEVTVQEVRVDSNYLNTYGIKLAEGRFLTLQSDRDPGSLVINEALVRQMGWKEPIGKTIQFRKDGTQFPVVGVVKDFNFSSLHQTVSPVVMYLDERKNNISVRIEPETVSSLLPQLKKLWQQFESRYPFDYYFIDDHFAKSYVAEQQMLLVISLFSVIAIFIACLGIYGLASFAIIRRTKEIGIRKVLGASISNIVLLLSSKFFRLVVFSILIAIPVVWYYMSNWLNNFAYHISLSWWVFVLAGAVVLTIVLVTISFQSLKAAFMNPVNSLKME